jgi:hypothetical protein
MEVRSWLLQRMTEASLVRARACGKMLTRASDRSETCINTCNMHLTLKISMLHLYMVIKVTSTEMCKVLVSSLNSSSRDWMVEQFLQEASTDESNDTVSNWTLHTHTCPQSMYEHAYSTQSLVATKRNTACFKKSIRVLLLMTEAADKVASTAASEVNKWWISQSSAQNAEHPTHPVRSSSIQPHYSSS